MRFVHTRGAWVWEEDWRLFLERALVDAPDEDHGEEGGEDGEPAESVEVFEAAVG